MPKKMTNKDRLLGLIERVEQLEPPIRGSGTSMDGLRRAMRDFGEVLTPEEAEEPILAPATRAALFEWMPECACPVLTSFIIPANDAMPSDIRQGFLPYLHRIAGSRSEEHEAARTRILWLAAVRFFAPIAFEEAGLYAAAKKLRHLPNDVSQAEAAKAVAAARKAAARKDVVSVDEAAWVAKLACEAAAAAIKAATKAAVWEADEAARAAAARLAARAAVATAVTAAKYAAKNAARANVVWYLYFLVLDEALNAGPQGEPWSADVMESAIADHPMVLAARLQRDASDPAEVFRTIVG